MNAAKQELQALLDTALRVKNEGLEDRFNMDLYESACGTNHCLAGWHLFFRHGAYQSGQGGLFVDWLIEEVMYPETDRWADGPSHAASFVLFGAHRGRGPDALDRQIKAIRWFLHRIEAMEEYERIRAMPRKERRKLRIAA